MSEMSALKDRTTEYPRRKESRTISGPISEQFGIWVSPRGILEIKSQVEDTLREWEWVTIFYTGKSHFVSGAAYNPPDITSPQRGERILVDYGGISLHDEQYRVLRFVLRKGKEQVALRELVEQTLREGGITGEYYPETGRSIVNDRGRDFAPGTIVYSLKPTTRREKRKRKVRRHVPMLV